MDQKTEPKPPKVVKKTVRKKRVKKEPAVKKTAKVIAVNNASDVKSKLLGVIENATPQELLIIRERLHTGCAAIGNNAPKTIKCKDGSVISGADYIAYCLTVLKNIQ
jgi:hypothetical protein